MVYSLASVFRNSLEVYGYLCRTVCEEANIQQGEFSILLFLADNPDKNTAMDVHKCGGMKQSMISTLVEKLVQKGYLERQPVPGDRRKVKLCKEWLMVALSVLLIVVQMQLDLKLPDYISSPGWNVAATMRHPEKETELQTLPGVKLYQMDVTDHAQVVAARDAAIVDFGGVDVVVNNAGYSYGGYFEEMENRKIRDMFEVNVFGLMDVTCAFLPHFREKHDGVFVQVSSVGGIASFPGVHLYNATKFAVEGFTEGVSYELGQSGIRSILIEPGTIATDFAGRSQLHAPNEIADYQRVSEKQGAAAKARGADGNGYDTPASVIAELIETALNDPEKKVRYADPSAQPMIDMRNNMEAEGFMKAMNKMFFGEWLERGNRL